MPRPIVFLTVLSLFSSTVFAGTIVDFRDQKGQDSQFLSEGKMGRLNMAGGKGYIILDYDQQSMKAVVPEHRKILDMNGDIPALSLGAQPLEKTPLTIEPDGDGPEIAGYETLKYKLSVNGEFCGTAFASREALEETGMDKMFKALQRMAEQTMKSVAAMQTAMSPCERGLSNTFEHIESIGAPLRSLDKTGKVEVEVTRIQTDVSLPDDTFVIPSDYAVVNVAEKMKKVESQLRTQLQKLQQNMPETEKKIADLQKSGKLTPEAAAKLKQLLQQQSPAKP